MIKCNHDLQVEKKTACNSDLRQLWIIALNQVATQGLGLRLFFTGGKMSQYYTEKQNVYVPGKGYDEYEVTVEIEDGDYNPTKRSTTIETRDGVRYVNGVPAYKIPGTLEYNELHKGDQK